MAKEGKFAREYERLRTLLSEKAALQHKLRHGHHVVRQKLRLSVDRIDVRIRQLREEIASLEADDAKQAKRVEEVNQVIGALKRAMEEDCKKVLDREDQRRGGVIGETYEKLNELLEVKRNAIVQAQS